MNNNHVKYIRTEQTTTFKLFMCGLNLYNVLPKFGDIKHVANNLKIKWNTPGKADCYICVSLDFQPHEEFNLIHINWK